MVHQHEMGRHERSFLHFSDENFPLAPDAVRDAYYGYWRATDHSLESLANRQVTMRETNQLIADFCDNYLTSQTYDAAMLADVADGFSSDRSADAAAQAIKAFYEQSVDRPEDKQFVLGLLSDRAVIQSFWQEQLDQLYADEPEHLALIRTTPDKSPVPRQVWQHKPLGTKATEILRLRTEHGVNIESLLIAAAETLQWLNSPLAGNSAETARRVHVAESLYAPFCEIIGFDGISMALQSRCNELRLQHTGRADTVELAREIITNMGGPSIVEYRVQLLLDAVLGKNVQEQVLTHMMPHGIVIGEGIALEDSLRVVWRQKTVGSLARKLATLEQGLVPMDIIGATVITEDAAQIGTTMQHVLRRIEADPRTQFASSPSRSAHLHVRGTPSYIDTVGQAMGFTADALRNHADVVATGPDSYQVTKTTFTFQRWGEPWPVHAELQFNTAADRVEARIGSAAHALHKLSDGNGHVATPEEVQAIAELHAQKKHLGQNGLTPISRMRAFQLEQLLALS